MFQLESMNNLKEVIRSQEKVMMEQQARMEELEEEHSAKELAIASITEENARLRAEFAAKSTEEKARFESELAELRGELAAKIVEEKQQCETEKTQLAEEFAEERLESESENAQELERAETKLQQCQSTIDYMGGVMLQNNKVMLEEQTLLASHANTIQEANEEIKRQRNSTLICEVAANTTALQSDTISLLRSSLSTALEFPQLSTKDLEQLDVAPFMLELMEAYNKQTEMIENL